MACVWKLLGKSPFWIGQFTDANGRRRNRSTKQIDRRRAQAVVDIWEKAARKARLSELTQAASIKILSELMKATTETPLYVESIASFLRKWADSRAALGRVQSTEKRYRAVLDSFITHLGERRAAASIASLSTAEIETWRDGHLAAGMSGTTVDFYLKVLKAALNAARRKGLILANPAEAAESAGGAPDTRDPFTPEELTALIREADTDWRGMVLVGLWCGLRIVNAANLTWGNVDLVRGILSFIPAKRRGKATTPLRVAIHPELWEHLNGLPAGVGNAPVFPSLYGRSSGDGLSKKFSALMARACVVSRKGQAKTGKGRVFNSKGFHSLRHTMISRFADANVSSDVRRAMAGHSSDAVHERYVHLNIDTQRRALKKLPGVA